MQNLRTLQPAPHGPGCANQRSTTNQPPEGQIGHDKKKINRHRHTDDEWEGQKELLAQLLYIHTVEEAAKIIKETRGFEAGYRYSKRLTLLDRL
jgi:hypothetical protein